MNESSNPEVERCSRILDTGERCPCPAVLGTNVCGTHGAAESLKAKRTVALKGDRYSHLLQGKFKEEYLKQLEDPERLELGAELATQRVLLSGFLKQIGSVDLDKLPYESLAALETAINGIRETVKVIGQLEGKLATQLTLNDVHFMNSQVVTAVSTVVTRYIADPAKRDEILQAISDELGRVRVPTSSRAL